MKKNNHIVISENIALILGGKYGKFSKIEPLKLKDGTYILPFEVLRHPDLKDFQKLIFPFISEDKIKEIDTLKDVIYRTENEV